MGSLIGHALPGAFFLIYGMWQAVCVTYRFHRSWRTRQRFNSTATYDDLIRRQVRLPVEALFKMVAATIGIAVESYAAAPIIFRDATNSQHATMYAFFFLSGMFDLLAYYGYAVPTGFDYVAMALAFVVEWLLFSSHTHGRAPMDIQVHRFLNYTIAACVLSTLWEMGHRSHPLAALSRIFFVLWHGAWFVVAGMVLYPPPHAGRWDPHSHAQMMVVTDLFAATAGGAVLFLVAVYWAVLEAVRRRGDVLDQVSVVSAAEYARLEVVSKPSTVHQVLPPAALLNSDSDEEEEEVVL